MGIPLDEEAIRPLAEYASELSRWNWKMNLTGLKDPQTIVDRLFLDSLEAAKLIPATAVSLLDVGSGAGFPGLPLAIARGGLKVSLLEPSQKKVAFLRTIIGKLGVDAEVIDRRLALFVVDTDRLFDIITIRALSVEALLPDLHHLLDDAGTILLFGSQRQSAALPQGLLLSRVHRYILPDGRRRLVSVLKKEG